MDHIDMIRCDICEEKMPAETSETTCYSFVICEACQMLSDEEMERIRAERLAEE